MKKQTLLIVSLCFLTTMGFSQAKFGIKGGLNYNFAGNITQIISGGSDKIISPETKAGYHFGIWTRFSIGGFSLQPEVVYTEIKNQYQISSRTNLKTKKLDIPVLFDRKLGPIHFFGGPAFQYILTSDFNTSTIGNVDFNKFTLGTVVGLGLEFGNVGVDARWEKGFSNNLNAVLISTLTNLSLDNRPNQIVLSLSYNLL